MKISKITITNFRLLKNVSLDLERELSIIVGKNNTGKTSILEVLDKFLGVKNNSFTLEDFHLSCFLKYELEKLYKKYETKKNKNINYDIINDSEFITKITDKLKIKLEIHIFYDKNDDLLQLNPFFLSLQENNNEVILSCSYGVDIKKIDEFFTTISGFEYNITSKQNCEKIKKYFNTTYCSLNNDRKVECEEKQVKSLINFKYIKASRGITEQNNNSISSLAKDYYETTHKKDGEENKFKSLEEETQKINDQLTKQYGLSFEGFFSSMELFNFKDLKEKNNLKIKSDIEYSSLIKDNSKIFYKSDDKNGIEIPEGHNGLGYTNLLFLCLKIKAFCDEFKTENKALNLLFIEEPEAHMHPQMQYIFIKNIKNFIEEKCKLKNIQNIMTTHSPYIISEANFNNLKYFNINNGKLLVKNCSNLEKRDKENIKFVKKYLNINKYEMFFADSIILVEGGTEKILLPYFMEKIDVNLKSKNISIIEVGGAYAHKFKKFIEFLDIKTLIITDIDYKTEENEIGFMSYNDVKDRETTNQTLIKLTKKNKVDEVLRILPNKDNGLLMITTQKPNQDGDLARSFEEAFIECNYKFFKDNFKCFSTFKTDKREETKKEVLSIFKDSVKTKFETKDTGTIKKIIGDNKKIDFTLDILLCINDETASNIKIPEYLTEGIEWLK